MNVAIIQPDVTFEDPVATRTTIEAMIDDVSIPPGSLVVLPEMTDTGVSLAIDRVADGSTLEWAASLARRLESWLTVGWATGGGRDKARNMLTFLSPDGSVAASYAKVFPCSPMGESSVFEGGDHLTVTELSGLPTAGMICYDLRFPELWRLATLAGAEAFVLIANWPARRCEHWRSLCIARAIENQAWVVACNRVGRDPNTTYAGGSLIVSPTGEILVEGSDHAEVITATIDTSAATAARAAFPVLRDLRRNLLGTLAEHPSNQ